jgi:quercetin dioxygenase-like cupin family protein
MRLFWLSGLFASILSPLQAQERMEVAITPLLSSTVTSSGQPIILPQQNPEVTASIYDVAPGVGLPVHKHPYPMYAYVLSGNLRVSNTETGRSNTYKAGDFILEAVGQWHMGANIGDEPLKLLVINIVEKGQSNTVLQRPSPDLPK